MKIIVLKFGGTSVGSLEKIAKVSKIIISYVKKNYKVVVVSSAMSGVTNELLLKTKKLAKNVLKVLKDRNGCLISNHGQLTISNNLNNALDLAVSHEKLSKQYYFCSFLKDTKTLSIKEMHKVLELFKDYKIKH